MYGGRRGGVVAGIMAACVCAWPATTAGNTTAAGKKPPAKRELPATPASTAEARWLPNPQDATWTYGWSDSQYQPAETFERFTVAARSDTSATLAWTTDDAGNAPETPASRGSIQYTYGDSGLFNTDWTSNPPPGQFPILCASATQCGNSLASSHYLVIWGSRSPLLKEPLHRGATWSSLGGQASDVASTNRYAGTERVVVPAFPLGVFAAKVVSDITQAGAIGDPYGSGRRTTWWTYGVGPVKTVFDHIGGQRSQAVLHATNLRPRTPPPDRPWFPLRQGTVQRFRYRNSKWLKKASTQSVTVGQVLSNGGTRLDVRDTAGPLKVRGLYVLSSGTTGIRASTVQSSALDTVRFPKTGPASAPVKERPKLLTPIDFLTYGYNPVLPQAPSAGLTWGSTKTGRDRQVYGVEGTTKVVGRQKVKTPAGRYTALLVESRLTQKGFAFGSGTRRAWFAAGVGLVKLEFRHKDGSVSTVERVK